MNPTREAPGAAWPRPVVVVSECLELAAVRYNGQTIRAPIIHALAPYVELRPVCPEVAIGLGVPRDPIRIVATGERRRLVQPSTGRDLTEDMERFARDFLSTVGDVDGFILKSRSPSCGIRDTKIHGESGGAPVDRDAGFFGRAVLAGFPHAAVEDEEGLTSFGLRHHFLTVLFTRAGFRRLLAAPSAAALVGFHARNELLLMAHHQAALRELGRTVAGRAGRPLGDVLADYEAGLGRALARPVRPGAMIDVLMHALGYLENVLTHAEKAHFLDAIEAYRADRLASGAPLTLLRSWVERSGEAWLADQTLFEPYPAGLLDPGDPGL